MTDLNWFNPTTIASEPIEKGCFTDLINHLKVFVDLLAVTPPPFVKNIVNKPAFKLLDDWASKIQPQCRQLVVLGTGGSSRGGQAICVLKKKTPENPNFVSPLFFENIGVHSMSKLLDNIDLSKTHFLVISKSGSTLETLAQCMVCMKAFSDHDMENKLGEHFTVISTDEENPLTQIAKKHGFQFVPHPADLGGRYSVLSAVGVAPSHAAGANVEALLSSATQSFEKLLDPSVSIYDKPAAVGAATQAKLYLENGITHTVLMPYDTRLVPFSRWFQQLWAESLGKEGRGTTPTIALGPIDQHSQLQLYLEGPRDKFFTIIMEDTRGKGNTIHSESKNHSYLHGQTIGDLIYAEARATIETLRRHDRPVRVITSSSIDENTLGQLFAHYMLETICMAHLIGVNPYDEPAVKEGKKLTERYLRELEQ